MWRDGGAVRARLDDIDRAATQRRLERGDALPEPGAAAMSGPAGPMALARSVARRLDGWRDGRRARRSVRGDAKLELIRSVPLFAGLPAASLEQLASLVDEIDLPPGTVLIREGAWAQEFFIIVSGSLLVRRGASVVARLGPGEFAGEIALVGGGFRTATVTTEERSRLLVLGRREFASLLSSNPTVELRILRALARRLRGLEPEGPRRIALS